MALLDGLRGNLAAFGKCSSTASPQENKTQYTRNLLELELTKFAELAKLEQVMLQQSGKHRLRT